MNIYLAEIFIQIYMYFVIQIFFSLLSFAVKDYLEDYGDGKKVKKRFGCGKLGELCNTHYDGENSHWKKQDRRLDPLPLHYARLLLLKT